MVEKQLLNGNEFYRELNAQGYAIGCNRVRAEVRAGRIRSVKINKRALVPRSELSDYPQRLLRGKRAKK